MKEGPSLHCNRVMNTADDESIPERISLLYFTRYHLSASPTLQRTNQTLDQCIFLRDTSVPNVAVKSFSVLCLTRWAPYRNFSLGTASPERNFTCFFHSFPPGTSNIS